MRMTEGQAGWEGTRSTQTPSFPLQHFSPLSPVTSRMKETAAWGPGKLKGGVGHIPPHSPRVILLNYLCVWLGCGHLDGLSPVLPSSCPYPDSALESFCSLREGVCRSVGHPEFSRMNSRGGCEQCFPTNHDSSHKLALPLNSCHTGSG